jgi:hypothetical protein
VLIAEVLATWPKRSKQRTYRALALRLAIYEQLVERDDVRQDLARLIERCHPILDRRFSIVGAAIVARQPRDEATAVALRKRTNDTQIRERLGL